MFHMQKAMKTGKGLKSYHPTEGYSWRRPGGKLGSAELQKFKAKSERNYTGIPGGKHGPHQDGQDSLPYTNVDRWAILGNRGYCILALGIIGL